MPQRTSARLASGRAAAAWGSPDLAGVVLEDLFEVLLEHVHAVPEARATLPAVLLEHVHAAPEARATLPAMRLVSPTWRAMVDASITELAPSERISDPELSQLLRRFRNLTAVNPDENRMPLRAADSTLPALQGLTKLRTLSLMSSVSPAGVRQLAPALGQTLTSLCYNGGGMTRARSGGSGNGLDDAAAAAIGEHLTNLQHLNISRCAELKGGVTGISALTKLHTLRLYELSGVKDHSLVQAVSGLTRLTSLTVAMCSIGDGSAHAVGRLTQLSALDLSQNFELSDAGVAELSSLRQLASLNLCATQVTCGTLPPLPALVHLEVASTETDDLGLAALEHQPALQRLSLADCMRVTGHGLYALRAIPGLRSLNLNSCLDLGDDDPIAALQYLTGLTNLRLAYVENLTDADIANLVPLTRLQALMLNGFSEVGQDCLTVLCSLSPALRTLHLPDLPLEPTQVEAVRAALPMLEEFTFSNPEAMQRLMEMMNANPDEEEDL